MRHIIHITGLRAAEIRKLYPDQVDELQAVAKHYADELSAQGLALIPESWEDAPGKRSDDKYCLAVEVVAKPPLLKKYEDETSR